MKLDGHFSIDVSRYLILPPDIKVRFDAWLTAEHLADKRIVKLRLDEGRIVVERYDDDNLPATVLDIIPVHTIPPLDALS